MAISDSNIVLAIQAFTSFSVQTQAEDTAGTNTTANIMYDTPSRTQGSYVVYKAYAISQLAADLSRLGKTATDAESEKAIAYLIASYQEAKDPDIFAKSVSFDGYSVSRDGQSGYTKAYQAFIDAIATAAITTMGDEDANGIVQTKDAEDYPESWRLSGLNTDDSDPF